MIEIHITYDCTYVHLYSMVQIHTTYFTCVHLYSIIEIHISIYHIVHMTEN